MLSEIIIQQIREIGPISFRDFMEICLYYPGLGYYTSPVEKIGKKGGYYTSSYISPVFGAMIGKQIEQMWQLMDEKPFSIVEYGAGTGMLCHDILVYLKNNRKLYKHLQYLIIEKSPVMREWEKKHLGEKVGWYDSIEEIGEFSGCVLSNELVDNFPVHQVLMEDRLMEVFVDYDNGFVERMRPAGKELTDYFGELDVVLPTGFRTEINLEATEWIGKIGSSLRKGYVITIDYGYPSAELYREYRREGTLICYNKHTINEDPYSSLGEQDITSHVNFSALSLWGLKNGLEACGLVDQARFLMGLGIDEYLGSLRRAKHSKGNISTEEEFIKKTLIIEMGGKFKVLIQKKSLPSHPLLGLKHLYGQLHFS
jgi:SAM-dependent MidA family methyltransferase